MQQHRMCNRHGLHQEGDGVMKVMSGRSEKAQERSKGMMQTRSLPRTSDKMRGIPEYLLQAQA